MFSFSGKVLIIFGLLLEIQIDSEELIGAEGPEKYISKVPNLNLS